MLVFEQLVLARDFRHSIKRVIAADEVTEEGLTRSILWLWMDHLHDVRQRRILAHVRLEERCRIASVQPVAYKTLWRGTKRLAADHTRTHDLHKVAQHLRVVD